MTDTIQKLGKLIEGEEQRDAIHIAVAPVTAAEMLSPGQHVGLSTSGHAEASGNRIGIVDPFLQGRVYKGDKFWLYLYPGSITSLLHHWTHPAFENKPTTTSAAAALSEQWIRGFVARVNGRMGDYRTYEEYMNVADERADGDDGSYICFGNDLDYDEFEDEFWTHYEIVRGKRVEQDRKQPFFRCAC